MNELRKHINRKLFYSPEVAVNIQPVVCLMVLYLDHLDFVFYTALCRRFHPHQLSTVSLVLKWRNTVQKLKSLQMENVPTRGGKNVSRMNHWT